jgi:hypothetical protein
MTRGSRLLTALIVVALMAAFGAGVNRYLASRTSGATAPETAPTTEHPQFTIPGTVYFADKGGLFALSGTTVKQIQAEGQGWTQPVLLPGGSGLLAVKVTANYYSDLYELSLTGTVEKQLSHDSGKVNATSLGNDDWLYYPSVGADDTLYFSYDYPKGNLRDPAECCYQVDYSIYSTRLGSTDINRAKIEGAVNGDQSGITQQSWGNYYTGGDVQPVALNGGGLIYTDYEAAGTSQLSTPLPTAAPDTEISQIRMDPKPVYGSSSSDGTPLTQPQDDCAEPALNPSQTEIAMVCTPVVNGAPDSSRADLAVATFDAATASIGPLRRIVTGTMAASPTWSPDGQGLLYLAPEPGDGYFQIWYAKNAAAAAPAAARQLTTHLDLDATSAPAWAA